GLRPNAAAFCLALGRMASLALANLKRIDIERRQALIEAELSAAAAAQRWILPRREARIGVFSYLGESRPGQYVGGDFFDVIPLGENKIAVALGDVSGKGIPASVLMTASQGFLHAALLEHGRPDRAVTNLNRFVNPRRPENKFITLWVGVFDAAAGTLSYVDAGHGYGIMLREDGTFEPLAGGEGLPIGVDADSIYQATTVPLPAGGAALIVSDGIIEQPGAGNTPAFEMEGVRRAISLPAPDRVAALFDAVIAHAATDKLSDDATAVMVRWEASTPA
ncbi:MAG TPA: PP2C family protein-serine/threonine phosphatase, partial [Tepidisphaeraceae bacterium]